MGIYCYKWVFILLITEVINLFLMVSMRKYMKITK